MIPRTARAESLVVVRFVVVVLVHSDNSTMFVSTVNVAVFCVAYAFYYYSCYTRHLRKARASGLPYVAVPVHMISPWWYLLHYRWVLPLLRALPERWTYPWLE